VSFTNRWIGRGGLHAWLEMLPDLTPLDLLPSVGSHEDTLSVQNKG